jgi:predicted nucleic acid-binding protein
MYLIDSNIFIEAKNRYYAFDIAPGFWEWLDIAYSAGSIRSIDQVRAELTVGTDPLSDWATARPDFFEEIDAATVAKFPVLSAWASAQPFTPAAITTFLGEADYFLVAHALAHGHTVVTHELSNPASKSRVLIPDACLAMGVPYCSPFAMMRDHGTTLVLP